jgi:hypothetical protein
MAHTADHPPECPLWVITGHTDKSAHVRFTPSYGNLGRLIQLGGYAEHCQGERGWEGEQSKIAKLRVNEWRSKVGTGRAGKLEQSNALPLTH